MHNYHNHYMFQYNNSCNQLCIVKITDLQIIKQNTAIQKLSLLLLAISYISYSGTRANTKPLYSVSRSFNGGNKKMGPCDIACVSCSELSIQAVLGFFFLNEEQT